jgi:tetratricopeptide (TPR) repeat protein
MTAGDDARLLFAQAQERQAAHDTAAGFALAQQALAADPDYVEAMEFVANALITRRRQYGEGLALVDRMVELRPEDAGVWYAAGWLYEFAAHEIARRRPAGVEIDERSLYERAAAAFRQCLAMHPDGKLRDDAEDLLDHVENELM